MDNKKIEEALELFKGSICGDGYAAVEKFAEAIGYVPEKPKITKLEVGFVYRNRNGEFLITHKDSNCLLHYLFLNGCVSPSRARGCHGEETDFAIDLEFISSFEEYYKTRLSGKGS